MKNFLNHPQKYFNFETVGRKRIENTYVKNIAGKMANQIKKAVNVWCIHIKIAKKYKTHGNKPINLNITLNTVLSSLLRSHVTLPLHNTLNSKYFFAIQVHICVRNIY